MAQAGDTYIVQLNPSQLGWGEERYTDSRPKRKGEAYLAIPKDIAKKYNLYNANYTNHQDILGKNIYNCVSSDGFLNAKVKSEGCTRKGDIYAKQFAGNKNLKLFGDWYDFMDATVGDEVEVYFISPTDIRLTLL